MEPTQLVSAAAHHTQQPSTEPGLPVLETNLSDGKTPRRSDASSLKSSKSHSKSETTLRAALVINTNTAPPMPLLTASGAAVLHHATTTSSSASRRSSSSQRPSPLSSASSPTSTSPTSASHSQAQHGKSTTTRSNQSSRVHSLTELDIQSGRSLGSKIQQMIAAGAVSLSPTQQDPLSRSSSVLSSPISIKTPHIPLSYTNSLGRPNKISFLASSPQHQDVPEDSYFKAESSTPRRGSLENLSPIHRSFSASSSALRQTLNANRSLLKAATGARSRTEVQQQEGTPLPLASIRRERSTSSLTQWVQSSIPSPILSAGPTMMQRFGSREVNSGEIVDDDGTPVQTKRGIPLFQGHHHESAWSVNSTDLAKTPMSPTLSEHNRSIMTPDPMTTLDPDAMADNKIDEEVVRLKRQVDEGMRVILIQFSAVSPSFALNGESQTSPKTPVSSPEYTQVAPEEVAATSTVKQSPRENSVPSKMKHAHSWPSLNTSGSNRSMLLVQVLGIARKILDLTPQELLESPVIATEIAQSLQDVLHEISQMSMHDPLLEEFVAKIIYVFSPCPRLMEYHRFYHPTVLARRKARKTTTKISFTDEAAQSRTSPNGIPEILPVAPSTQSIKTSLSSKSATSLEASPAVPSTSDTSIASPALSANTLSTTKDSVRSAPTSPKVQRPFFVRLLQSRLGKSASPTPPSPIPKKGKEDIPSRTASASDSRTPIMSSPDLTTSSTRKKSEVALSHSIESNSITRLFKQIKVGLKSPSVSKLPSKMQHAPAPVSESTADQQVLTTSSSTGSGMSTGLQSTHSVVSSENLVVCRICEKTIHADDLEWHTAHCAAQSECELERETIDNETLKYLEDIKASQGPNWEVTAATLDKVIRVSERDAEAINKLTKYKHRLNQLTPPATAEIITAVAKKRAVAYKYRDKVKPLIRRKVSRGGSFSSEDSRLRGNSSHSLSSSMPAPPKKHFLSLFAAMLKMNRARSDSTQSNGSEVTSNTRTTTKMPRIQDFQIVKPISKGAYGKVYLAKKKTTGDIYAIKILKKEDMVRKNMVHHILNERRVLALSKTPFIVKLYYAFQSRSYLYLVMEYIPGGDLASLLRSLGAFPEPMARVYLGEAILALEYLHHQGMVHRDIKPDNMLIGSDGHLKLTDFGLARIVVPEGQPVHLRLTTKNDAGKRNPRRPTFRMGLNEISAGSRASQRSEEPILGTPDYLAPELLLGLAHDGAVDYWALGVCLYEFIVGSPPFNDDSPEDIFANILSQSQIVFPVDDEGNHELTAPVRSLITAMLDHDPKRRLGCPEIKAHPFFHPKPDSGQGKVFDFADVSLNEPPFVPHMDDQNDTKYFDMRGDHEQFVLDMEMRGEDGAAGKDNQSLQPSISHSMASDVPRKIPQALQIHRGLIVREDSTLAGVKLDLLDDPEPLATGPAPKDEFEAFHFKNVEHLESINKQAVKTSRIQNP